jgi:hypothetical protein
MEAKHSLHIERFMVHHNDYKSNTHLTLQLFSFLNRPCLADMQKTGIAIAIALIGKLG